MTIATDKITYSFAEYLQLEETAAYKNEYQDGEIVPMTGGTTDHNKIALNFAAYLKFALKGQKYNIFIGDLKLWIAQYRQATYPDVMLIEGEPIYYETMQYNKTEENKWLLTEYEGENASLSLTSVNFALSFQEIYEGVTFNIIND
ncbi:MAG: Uma2 family endonuclease [Microcystis aeruginosa W13-18]|nr:Uma2 family endonuclease [Microcystis aeruginosa W13-18]